MNKTHKKSPLLPNKNAADFQLRAQQLLKRTDRNELEADARNLLRDYPQQAEAHFILARALVESKRKNQAFPYAEAACKLAPNNAHYVYYLGFLYMDFRLHEFALPLLRKALDMAPQVSQFHEALGDCYQEIGKGEVGIRYLQKAFDTASDQISRERVQSKLAHALLTADRLEEAQQVADALLKGSPKAYVAGVRESALLSKSGVESAEGEKVIELLNSNRLDAKKKVDFYLVLGRMYERDKKYDSAFRCWYKARELSKEDDWHVKEHAPMLEETKQFYTADLFPALETLGHPSEVPVFVVGMPRSGTTLTEQIIAAHPRAAGVGELARFDALDKAFRKDYPAERRLARMVKNAETGEFRARAEETLRIFDIVSEVKRDRIVEKTPHAFRNVGYLRLMFPKARFIHCRRHPLDTFISSYQNNLNRSHGYAYDQVEYLKEYLYQDELMRYWNGVIPGQILTLHYEQLTNDPDFWARRLIEFIGLDWDENCLRFFETAGTVRTFSTQQVRSPVNTSSVARWLRYKDQLSPIIAALEESGFKYPAFDT